MSARILSTFSQKKEKHLQCTVNDHHNKSMLKKCSRFFVIQINLKKPFLFFLFLPHPMPVITHIGGQNNGLNSQMVRQGLRAVVSGRQTVGNGSGSNNGIRRNMSSPLDTLVGGPNGNGNLVDTNTNPNNPNNNLMINQQQQQQTQQQQLPNQMINADMDPTMRFGFEMSQGKEFCCYLYEL